MTTMTMALCAVFGGSITEEAAKSLSIATLKNTMLKQPIRTVARELSKFVPGLGLVVAPAVTVAMLEAAKEQGIPADAIVKESAPAQFEVNLHHTEDAIKACDYALLLKRLIASSDPGMPDLWSAR